MKCVCGETIKKNKRVAHMHECEAFHNACVDEVQRLAQIGGVTAHLWQRCSIDALPSAPSVINAFDNWGSFLAWLGQDQQKTYKCPCGYSTESPVLYGTHYRDCEAWAAWVIDELLRITGELGYEPEQRDWNTHKGKGYPAARIIKRIWGDWRSFQHESLLRSLSQTPRVDAWKYPDGMPVCSVRIEGNEACYMLR